MSPDRMICPLTDEPCVAQGHACEDHPKPLCEQAIEDLTREFVKLGALSLTDAGSQLLEDGAMGNEAALQKLEIIVKNNADKQIESFAKLFIEKLDELGIQDPNLMRLLYLRAAQNAGPKLMNLFGQSYTLEEEAAYNDKMDKNIPPSF